MTSYMHLQMMVRALALLLVAVVGQTVRADVQVSLLQPQGIRFSFPGNSHKLFLCVFLNLMSCLPGPVRSGSVRAGRSVVVFTFDSQKLKIKFDLTPKDAAVSNDVNTLGVRVSIPFVTAWQRDTRSTREW